MSAASPALGFAIGYGELENRLADLGGTDGDAIRTRFRKLRLKPFLDDIQTGTGKRVRYDLPRSLAIMATFELNGLLFPQGQSVWMVERAWPEFCRAAIAGAVEAGILPRPRAMPASAGPLVTLFPDAFASGAQAEVLAARIGPDDMEAAGAPLVVVDARRFVAALAPDAENPPAGLSAALGRLELAFGWTAPALPGGVTRLSEFDRGGGTFLERGPFFERATALLSAPAKAFGEASPHTRARLQALLDYVLDPAPVDQWKGFVGDERPTGGPGLRLRQLLSEFGSVRGLEPSKTWPGTVMTALEGDLAATAMDFVRRATDARRRAG